MTHNATGEQKRVWFYTLLLSSMVLALATNANEARKTRQVVYSPNGKFFAVSDPKEERTTVFSIKQNMQEKTKVWSYDGNFEAFYLSTNGMILATLPNEWSRVTLRDLSKEAMKSSVMVILHHADGKKMELTLDRFFRDVRKLKASDYPHEYSWGHIVGFDEDNHLVIDTLERHRFTIDVYTAAIYSDEDLNAKK